MKAKKIDTVAGCMDNDRALVAVVLEGGVHKKKTSGRRQEKSRPDRNGVDNRQRNGQEENTEEIREYLGKLQELVPFMPKNKRLSKLEVISNVIDYIHDLRETLGLPPCQQQSMEWDCTSVDDDFEDDTSNPETPQPVNNQTFKVSLARANHSEFSAALSDNISSAPQRLPLTSISSPRNTDLMCSIPEDSSSIVIRSSVNNS